MTITITTYPERLDDLITVADQRNFTIDFLEALTRGLDQAGTHAVLANLVHMPPALSESNNPHMRRDWRYARQRNEEVF